MKGIIQYFSNIWNLLLSVWKLIISFITHFGDFWNYARQIELTYMNIINTLPPWLQYFAIITLIVSILFLMLGRSGGKSR